MRNELIASASSEKELEQKISEYWFCEPKNLLLDPEGRVWKKGVVVNNFAWRKQKGRYRFEALT